MSDEGSSPKTWTDIARDQESVEDPQAPLDIDLARWDPITISTRLLKISNALIKLYKSQAESQKRISELGGKRSGDVYSATRGSLYIVEGNIKSLEEKRDTLKELSFNKRQEFKNMRT